MSINSRQKLQFKDLGCANCAGKIEKEVSCIEGMVSASLDFATKRLTFVYEGVLNENGIIGEIERISQRIEPGIRVIKEQETGMDDLTPSNTKKLVRFGIGILIFFVSRLGNFNATLEICLYLVSYILIGGEVLLYAAKNILRGRVFDENFLMCIATIGAFSINEYPEAVAVMLFYQIGELFQGSAVNRSRRSIKELMDIRPDYANLKKDNDMFKVAPEDVRIGDFIIVKPGEKVPLDGKVVDGRSMVDTSALTGESVPRELAEGDEILSGFVNKNGLLTIQVGKEYGESTVSKILELVQNANSKKSRTEKFITKFANVYTPAVVLSALMLAFIPPIFISGISFIDSISRALVFLVISCPCALVISIPLGFFGGIGGASRNGILIKGSNYIEVLHQADTVVFDKTGTLTKGVFKVTEAVFEPGYSRDELIEYAAYAEAFSTHPIANSILKAYGQDINKDAIKSHDEKPGFGTRVTAFGRNILAGNAKLMNEEGIAVSEEKGSGTIVYIAVDGSLCGRIVIADEIKEDAPRAIKSLRDLGIKKIVILTGDNEEAANKIADKLGVHEVYSGLLPQDKVNKLEELEDNLDRRKKLVFVGDGINDAPVLARADVGVAMGGLGSDAAIEAADVVLMTDEPAKLAGAIKIARKTRDIVWQNIILAMSIKILVMALGAGGIATMWEAVFADVGVALLAILNAMRVMKMKIDFL